MAMDTAQKRMSAMHLTCPWRGPVVDAIEAGFDQGNRAAADGYYSALVGAGGGGGASERLLTCLGCGG